ncbi:hypothetical protein MNBD_GAMMA12-76 [hydrothermal vent metagenome]|uniref:Uncharacterized protein n=1 Tax=hydrothermal vent metagenome TaxID=652676 RepID=A0A3B0Y5C1_9ZZZZ
MNEKFEKNFVNQCNQSITDSLTTYKGHFNVAARWRMVHLVLGCAVAACSFVAGASIIGEI